MKCKFTNLLLLFAMYVQTPHYGTRKALGERNGTNDTMFSQTTISGFGGSVQSLHSQPDMSLASVGGYNDFAVSIPLNSTVQSAPGDPPMSRCTSSPSLARTDEIQVTQLCERALLTCVHGCTLVTVFVQSFLAVYFHS